MKKLLILKLISLAAIIGIFLYSIAKAQPIVDVKEKKETIIIKDKDGDGIYDRDDPNPEISEIYIVIDDNKNGIVDSFEKNLN